MQSAIAIVEPQFICAVGLQHLLHLMLPSASVLVYNNISDCITDIERSDGERPYFVYFFVDEDLLAPYKHYFAALPQMTVALSILPVPKIRTYDFPVLNLMADEQSIWQQLLNLSEHTPTAKNIVSPSPLTDREIEVLQLVAKGLMNKEIASRLCISQNTVVTHRTHITDKLGIRSVPALTVYAVVNGWVDYNEINI